MSITQSSLPRSCQICLKNKITKSPKSQEEISIHDTKALCCIHSDICGPIDPPSREGYKYVINFIDEYSSMSFVYLLRQKDEAQIALKKYLAEVAPIGSVKEIHTDNGGEYLSQAFQQVLLDNQIKHTTTAPYSPFQNGKSESSWRSLMEMTRCLRLDADVPKSYWPYAVRYAQYLRNRSFQRRTHCTAYELFTGQKPDMRKL